MDHIQAEAWLHSLPHRTRMPGVESERQLLARLGNPEASLKFVHIVGTNGKGSTAAMLSSILQKAGYKVGCTISPFVLEFRERFQINGEMIPTDQLAAVTDQVRRAAEQMEAETGELPCEFAAVTAVALVWFAQSGCDIVVLEAGIGGRLDATNAVENTETVCITHIGLDHTDMLGETTGAIAAEKCGVFRPGRPVICYPEQPQDAFDEIVVRAHDMGCELVVPELEDLHPRRGRPLENRFDYGGYEVVLSLPGPHQQRNTMVVIETALALWRRGWDISDDAILQGLYAVHFPARVEVVRRDPLIIIDGCHNPDGAAALALTLRQAKLEGMACIMGMMKDKDCTGVLRQLTDSFDHLYTVAPAGPRAMDPDQLADLAKPFFGRATVCDSLADALELAWEDGFEGCVICGSLYLASEARAMLVPAKN